MRLVAHQPEYIPYLGFFAKVHTADLYLVSDHLQYADKDFQNRNYIRGQNGKKTYLTVPVLLSGNGWDQAINEIEISNARKWAKKHWLTMYHVYNKAPHFHRYAETLEEIYKRDWEKLLDLNMTLLRNIFGWLDMDVKMEMTSTFDLKESKTDLLVEMCRKTGADTFISGRGARDYVILERFEAEGLEHRFFEFEHPEYDQHGFEDFLPNLSILDLLFNEGPDARLVLDEAVDRSPLART